MRDKLIGTMVTLSTSLIMFLTYSYTNSFESKADAESKYSQLEKDSSERYNKLDKKLGKVICLLDKKQCLQGE